MELTRHKDVETALAELSAESCEAPGTLYLRVRQLAHRLLEEEAYNREEILEIFEQFRSVLRDEGRDHQEDELLDVMDQLAGWSSPTRASKALA